MEQQSFRPGTKQELAKQWEELETEKQEALARIRSTRENNKGETTWN